jgi:myo-inositol-1(or 4)-monophosphatase
MAIQNVTPSSQQLDAFLAAALEAASLAEIEQLQYFGRVTQIDEKFQAGLVSEADKSCEEIIRSAILARFPDHSFFGEETGLAKGRDSEYIWMVDPIDGTTNFVHGFPVFCSSIGLQVRGELVVGVVNAPVLKMKYTAVRGRGAFLNGQPIHVSQRVQFKDALFATGFFGHDPKIDQQLRLVRMAVQKTRGVRRAGSAAMDLCWLAQGVFDIYWERNLQPWDTAAGCLIAREAGAVVTNLDNEPYRPDMLDVVAGNPQIHGEFMKALVAGS